MFVRCRAGAITCYWRRNMNRLRTTMGLLMAAATAALPSMLLAEEGSSTSKSTGLISDAGSQLGYYIETYAVPAVGVLVVFFLAFIIAGWLKRLVHRGLSKTKLDEIIVRFIASLVRWAIIIMALLSCLEKFGIQTTSFAALIGAAGLAIGLAFQGTLSNVASGFMLLLFRPFAAGHVINVAGHIGQVDELGLFSTELVTADNRRIIIPNSQVFGSTIENITAHDRRRVDVGVGVEYQADLDKTREVLTEAAKRIKKQATDKPPTVVLVGLGASSVDWELRAWCHPSDYFAVRESALEEAKKALDAAGLGIPFPQMDVHLFNEKNEEKAA